ncbi:EmrB/QacA subfamily drug resistance transporter [Haloactinopolyspora alba]|uniref:EmrB/QacA subfamily drug resistance transporter n=1 Tax=Haloactinopolyspora alba TaxID=648780 RepID=A0A2P8E9D3_9ACTN|nr:MFS transporter [Haloactinopolyspora alba]PSL06080.1 EmrB/QacA subfamily drug resistance transporter [Haloactinopolyspora alba]
MSERTLPSPRPAPEDSAERAGTRPGLALAVLLTCQLMIVLDITVMNVALPHIRADLGFSTTGLSWVMNAYTLAFGGMLLLGGRAGDLFGRRRLFIGGIAVFTVASFVGGTADTPALLIAARIAQGLGSAAAGPSTLALITTTFTEPQRRMRALALFGGVSSAGFAIGLILGGLLTELFSWRSVLFINVPFGIAIAVLARRILAEPERRPSRLDLPGAVTASAGVASLVYGFIRAGDEGWSDPGSQILLVAGALLLAAFVTIEARTRHPLLPLRLFADRNRATGYAMFFLGPMSAMSTFFFLTQYLQDVREFSSLATGFAFVPLAAVLFTMTRLAPRLLPRFGPRPLAVAGTTSLALALAWLTRLTPDSAYLPGMFGPMVLMGLGMGLAFAPMNIVIMSSVPADDAGAAGGALQTLQQTGGALGLAVLVTVYGTTTQDAAADGRSGADVLVDGMTSVFTAAVGIAAIAFLVALTFRRRERT